MASHPPAQCCTVGVKHEGTPSGSSIKVGDGIDAYVAEPTGKTVHKDTAIIFLPDVISIWQNSKLIADQFAANGYYTLVLDLFNGDPLFLNRPPGFDLKSWISKGTNGDNPHTIKEIDIIVEAGIKFLQEEKGIKHIGAVGYCFGAKYVVRFLSKGKGITAGYCAHPSFVEENELKLIDGPLSISAAENDNLFTAEQRQKSEVILKTTGQPWQINLFSEVVHGFAVRGDPSVKIEKWSKEQAFFQAVAWLDHHLI